MSDNVLETVRATVQDFLAPELKTHGVRLDNIERRLDDTKHSLEQRLDDLKNSLEHRILDAKETLRAEMRSLDGKMDILEVKLGSRLSLIEDMIRNLTQQISIESSLRERVASLEARMPKQ